MTEFRYGEQVLGRYDDSERERVALVAGTYDPATFGFLSGLGVGAGWRCLEAGAGSGTVARWLASRVAPATVLAVDRDVRFLGEITEPNLLVKELDLVSDDLPEQEFGLVFSRMVLLHLPEREAVLDKLVRAVAPGGYLAITETDVALCLGTASPDLRAMWQAINAVLTAAMGMDITWVRTLPDRFAGLGLTEVDVRADALTIRGGGVIARCAEMTLDAVSAAAVQRGIADQATMDRARALLRDPRFVDLGPTVIHTWGRKQSQIRR